jgi:hypothetical protein
LNSVISSDLDSLVTVIVYLIISPFLYTTGSGDHFFCTEAFGIPGTEIESFSTGAVVEGSSSDCFGPFTGATTVNGAVAVGARVTMLTRVLSSSGAVTVQVTLIDNPAFNGVASFTSPSNGVAKVKSPVHAVAIAAPANPSSVSCSLTYHLLCS